MRLLLFAAACVLQLAVPAYMIATVESTLESGERFLFRTAPVDPADLFRGRYVQLGVRANAGPALDAEPFLEGQKVYALLALDDEGFATIRGVQHAQPDQGAYLEVPVRKQLDGSVRVHFPIDRYYMNEKLAPEAERAYREGRGDTSWIAVRVLNGRAVLEELYVDGAPIAELLATRARQAEEQRAE